MLTDDERKILNDYLVKSFETASDLNLFLVETVWPRYRVSRIPALKVHPHYVTLGGVPIPLRDIVQLARERAVVRDTRSGQTVRLEAHGRDSIVASPHLTT